MNIDNQMSEQSSSTDSITRQLKAIRSVLIKAHSEVCNSCSFEFVPMLRINGECPCPKCDADVIEQVTEKGE